MKAWQDIIDIGPLCHEQFLGSAYAPEITQLDIQVAGVSQLAGHYRVGFSTRETHILTYTTTGWGKLHTPDGVQYVEPNSLIVLPVGQPFLYEIASKEWSMAWVILKDTPRWQALQGGAIRVDYCESSQVIYHLLCLLYYEQNPRLRRQPLEQLEHYLSESINKLRESHNQGNRLHALFRNIENQLHKKWSVETMSQQIHYSAPHLHRLCNETFGRSPIQQLIFLRIQRALHLLSNTDWPIAQIAGAVGYSDVFNFSKRFKNSTGQTPTQYRKNQ